MLRAVWCLRLKNKGKNQAAPFLRDPLGKFASKLLPGSSYTMCEVWKCDRHVALDSHRGVQWPQGVQQSKALYLFESHKSILLFDKNSIVY